MRRPRIAANEVSSPQASWLKQTRARVMCELSRWVIVTVCDLATLRRDARRTQSYPSPTAALKSIGTSESAS